MTSQPCSGVVLVQPEGVATGAGVLAAGAAAAGADEVLVPLPVWLAVSFSSLATQNLSALSLPVHR